MMLWKAELSSASAKGIALIDAASKSEAKNSIFNQFLGIEPSKIIWDSPPTFWVVMHSIYPAVYEDQHEA